MLKVLELFGGIGACSKALERLGIEHEIVDYVEIDKYAVRSFNAIHGTEFEPQDICEWDKDIEVDLIMHGSPCQDFSTAGANAGGDEGSGTRSSLMYETVRIVQKIKPKYVIWENVKNVLSKTHKHNFDNYINRMNELGYASYYEILNSKDYGIPQNRERVFVISILNEDEFQFPMKKELNNTMGDLLEDEVEDKHYLSEKMIKYISSRGTGTYRNPDCKINLNIARPLTTSPTKRAGTTNYICDDLPKEFDLNDLFKFPPKQELKVKLKDMLEEKVDDKYYLNEDMKSKFIYKKTNGVTQEIGYIKKSENGTQHQSNTVYSDEGVARTLIAQEYKSPLMICNNTKKGYLEANEGDGVYTNISNKRGTVQKEMIQTITTRQELGVVVENLNIRRLTPKECWRLMGFDDSDFEKASKVNSNTQLYKQAGNSIVVNVLEAILKELLIAHKEEDVMTIDDYLMLQIVNL